MTSPNEEQMCRRCGRSVASADFETFEHMHYACFHYEFEHGDVDVDAECNAGGCPSRRAELRTTLREWSDWDSAAFELGRAIGFYERTGDFDRFKGDFWTDNPIGNGLHEALVNLARAGILEHREEPELQFRWRRSR